MTAERKQEKKDPFGLENVRVVQQDMAEELRDTTMAAAKQALTAFYHGEHRYYHEVAQSVKSSMDKEAGGVWHVIVGRSFGCDISVEVGKYAPHRGPRAAPPPAQGGVRARMVRCPPPHRPPPGPNAGPRRCRLLYFFLGPVCFLIYQHG